MSRLKDLFAKFLRLHKVLVGIDKYIKQDIVLPVKAFGNNGSSWALVPELLDESSIFYSFGVGDDISFDLGLINHVDLPVYAFDPTPGSIEWVSRQKLPKQFLHNPVGLANFNGKAKFHPPQEPNQISATMLARDETKNEAYKVEVRTLKSIMEELGHKHIDLLKMNIEGAEYDVIENMRDENIKPSQLLVEFHHCFKNIDAKKTIKAVKILRGMGYKVFYVSKTGMEIALVQASLIGSLSIEERLTTG